MRLAFFMPIKSAVAFQWMANSLYSLRICSFPSKSSQRMYRKRRELMGLSQSAHDPTETRSRNYNAQSIMHVTKS